MALVQLLGQFRLEPFPEGRLQEPGAAHVPVGYVHNLVEFQVLDPGGVIKRLGSDLPGSPAALELDYNQVAAALDTEKVDDTPEHGSHLSANDHEAGVNGRNIARQPVF